MSRNRQCILTRHDQPVFAHGEGQAGQVLPLIRHRIEALDAAQHHLVVLPANCHYHFSCPCYHGNSGRGEEQRGVSTVMPMQGMFT